MVVMRTIVVSFTIFHYCSLGCIPTRTEETVVVVTSAPTTVATTVATVTTTTAAAAETTTTADPCQGCVPPPVLTSGFLDLCAPDTPGTVSVALSREGNMCRLTATGCPIGYLYVLNGIICAFTMTPQLPMSIMCMNGNFYQTAADGTLLLISYFVGGCSTFVFPP